MEKFKNSYLGLILFIIINIVAGLHLMLQPEEVNHWVIRALGLIWVIEGISYISNLIKKMLDKK